jgi:hypothetical protein
MKSINYYSCRDLLMPERPHQPTLKSNPTAAEAKIYSQLLEIYEKQYAEYDKKREEIREQRAARHKEFQQDVLEKFGLDKHPKADNIFQYVWERADSYNDVIDHLEQLAELF